MRKIYLIGAAAISIALAAGAYIVAGNLSAGNQPGQDRALEKELVWQSSIEGGVTVEAALVDREKDGGSLEIAISLNTHSTELDQDMVSVSVLEDEAGNRYQPVAWEGDPAGGHHRSGVLKFTDIPASGKMRLVIGDIAGYDREFEWQL